ncbi:MAG: PBP1A family penicillin-binding protein [Candidatus Portnoybacteria bacterium]|nr:PBP1A family penicillin-binding protein [Candidatus Portnoybacteria bacterium]
MAERKNRLKRKNIKGRVKRIINTLLFISLLLGIFIVAAILGVFAYFLKDLPNPDKIAERQVVESTKIYDRTGTVVLYDIHGEEKRTVVPFDRMPDSIKKATIAVEDANFYNHFGLDFKGILRAIFADLKGQTLSQGGSTITQQFIKSSFLGPEKTFARKIKEAILAIEFEAKYPKDKILEAYLNQIPYGSNAYGIEAAAQTFFNKPAKDLTLAESTLLASLPKAPSYYSPYGSRLSELKDRQKYVLGRLVELGFITTEEAQEAAEEKLALAPASANNIKAPHFVMYVKEYLEEKYGRDYVEKSGLKVYTTIDWQLQQLAEQIILDEVAQNEKKYKAFNASLVAVDPKTSQLLAMVGSKGYFLSPTPAGCDPGKNCLFEPNVNVAIRDRQPGSSFKPFAYALAIKKGFTPKTVLFDLPTEFNPSCPASAGYDSYEEQKCYNPQNYDGRFRGPTTLQEALAQSLNVPSVKVLYLSGVNDTINLAQDMGITTLKDRRRYGLALVLGGGEVKLLDIVSAYGVFANQGTYRKTAPILKIETNEGQTIEEWQNKPIAVLDPDIANTISDILSNNILRTPVFGSSSPLNLGNRPAAVKTGTTQEYRDAWTIGYTPSLVAGVWAGNNDNTPMTKEGAGLYAAAPLWNKFMKRAYEIKNKKSDNQIASSRDDNNPFNSPTEIKSPTQNFPEFTLPGQVEQFPDLPDFQTDKSVLSGDAFSAETYQIDSVSGKLATPFTPPELIRKVQSKQAHCILYYVNKDNPRGASLINPASDPQFTNWEFPVLEWAERQNIFNQPPINESDDVHTAENQPQIKIVNPENNSPINSRWISIKTQVSAPLGVKQVDFFFDNDFIASDPTDPYETTYNLPKNTALGEHTIKAKVYDTALNRQEAETTIILHPSMSGDILDKLKDQLPNPTPSQ